MSMETALVEPGGEILARSFIYEPEATLDIFTSIRSKRPAQKTPIGRTRELNFVHLKMIAGILATVHDEHFSGAIH